MNAARPLRAPSLFCRGLVLAILTALLGGCCSFRPFQAVTLVSHPASLAALKRGDLHAAARVLEARLAASPADAEAAYTLGSIYLVQSEGVSDTRSRRGLQARGWALVEAASGKHGHADVLLGHAYHVGRWGKRRNISLYEKHLRLWLEVPPTRRGEAFSQGERVWRHLWRSSSTPVWPQKRPASGA